MVAFLKLYNLIYYFTEAHSKVLARIGSYLLAGQIDLLKNGHQKAVARVASFRITNH
jgi:hypothetical protein